MINHMYDILEAIIDQIFLKLSAMPYVLREFFFNLYKECSAKWGTTLNNQKLYGIIADFMICKWLVPVCFFNLS